MDKLRLILGKLLLHDLQYGMFLKLAVLGALFFVFGSVVLVGESSGQEEAEEMEKRSIVIIGASYAKAWDLERLGNRTVLNTGINGNQSFEMLDRFQEDVLAHAPEVVIIWGFINDIFRGDRAKIAKVRQDAIENFSRMVDLARNEGVVPIIATEVSIRGPAGWKESLIGLIGSVLRKRSYQDYINENVVAVNQWLKEFTEREGILLLDFYSVLAEPDGLRKKLYAATDGSHISETGYEALSEYARPIIEEALPQ